MPHVYLPVSNFYVLYDVKKNILIQKKFMLYNIILLFTLASLKFILDQKTHFVVGYFNRGIELIQNY